MDVVGLKDAAQVGFVRLALAQALEGRFLVAEGLQKSERKLLGIERLLGEGGYGFFDLNGVHAAPFPIVKLPLFPGPIARNEADHDAGYKGCADRETDEPTKGSGFREGLHHSLS